MFDNIGGKIKGIAIIFFIFELVCVFFSGIAAMASGDEGFFIGIVIMVAGFFISYLSVILFYAFGELVENSAIIAENTGEYRDTYAREHPLLDRSVTSSVVTPISNIGHSNASQAVVSDYWKCPTCGRTNHKTSGTCGCGQKRP